MTRGTPILGNLHVRIASRSKILPKRLNSLASGSVACVRRVFGSWSGDSEASSHANATPRQGWNASHLRLGVTWGAVAKTMSKRIRKCVSESKSWTNDETCRLKLTSFLDVFSQMRIIIGWKGRKTHFKIIAAKEQQSSKDHTWSKFIMNQSFLAGI